MSGRPMVLDQAARKYNEKMEELSEKMAAQMPPGANRKPVSPHRERLDYWQRAITPEEEQILWQEVLQAAAQDGLAPEDAILRATPRIAISVYPARAPLIRDADRKLSIGKQISYAQMQERLGPPDTEGGESYGA